MSPQAHCEACTTLAQHLQVSELSPLVDYFCCPQCAGVWTQPKPGCVGERRMIIVPQSPENEASSPDGR